MGKDIKIILLFLGIIVLSGLLLFGDIVKADEEGLVVEFEQEPLFSETNLGPSDSVTHWIKITNNSDNTQRVAIKADNIQECSGVDCLSDTLEILIKEGIVELYNNSLTQFYSEDEVFLSSLSSGNSTQYDITVNFPEISGDIYQGKTTGFDLVIGFQLTGRVAGAATKKPGKVLGAETGSSLKLSLGVASVSSLLASIGLYLLSKVTNGKDWRKKKRKR